MDNVTLGMTGFYILGALLVIAVSLVILVAKKEG